MRLGICAPVDKADEFKASGWGHVEAGAVSLFDGRLGEDEAPDGRSIVAEAALPVPCCNMLVPGDVAITGADRDDARLEAYIARTIARAGAAGVPKLVFGSGAARKIRDGQSREEAREQILAFLRTAALHANKHGVTIVIEPLRSAECNIINSVAEGMEYVEAVGDPAVACLVDSYHLWEESEPLANLERAMPQIKHVHVADVGTRAGPGQTTESDPATPA